MSNLPWGAEFEPDAPWLDRGAYYFCHNGCNLTPYEREDPIIIEGQPYCDRCAANRIKLETVSDKTKKLVKEVDSLNYQKLHESEYAKLGKLKHI